GQGSFGSAKLRRLLRDSSGHPRRPGLPAAGRGQLPVPERQLSCPRGRCRSVIVQPAAASGRPAACGCAFRLMQVNGGQEPVARLPCGRSPRQEEKGVRKAGNWLMGLLLGAGLGSAQATISDNEIRIGLVSDFSSVYREIGWGSEIAAEMAIEDFGGTVRGK